VDVQPGSGAEVAVGDLVSVHYVGFLVDGTRFAATTRTPFTFRVGERSVIDGWEDGVIGMRVGGRRQLVIPPFLGYGREGKGTIPPNAVLVFDLTLAIRGMNTSTGQAVVGIYYDETPMQTRLSSPTNFTSLLPAVFDLSRVEIVNGPQGTLFGAGAEAGAVRFIPNPASMTEYVRSVEIAPYTAAAMNSRMPVKNITEFISVMR
jgi:hypothetical protein